MQIKPFSVHVPDADIDDLQRRLRATRWPPRTAAEPWQRGADADWLRELAHYWAGEFDWRAAERKLNAQPQFMAEVDGQRIHFVHRKGVGPAPYPIVITHGWPGSFFEFYAILDQLCDPAAFGGIRRTPSMWSCRRFPVSLFRRCRPAPEWLRFRSPICGPD